MATSPRTLVRQGSLAYLLVIHQLYGDLNASQETVRGRLYVLGSTAASNAPLQPTLVFRVSPTSRPHAANPYISCACAVTALTSRL